MWFLESLAIRFARGFEKEAFSVDVSTKTDSRFDVPLVEANQGESRALILGKGIEKCRGGWHWAHCAALRLAVHWRIQTEVSFPRAKSLARWLDARNLPRWSTRIAIRYAEFCFDPPLELLNPNIRKACMRITLTHKLHCNHIAYCPFTMGHLHCSRSTS